MQHHPKIVPVDSETEANSPSRSPSPSPPLSADNPFMFHMMYPRPDVAPELPIQSIVTVLEGIVESLKDIRLSVDCLTKSVLKINKTLDKQMT